MTQTSKHLFELEFVDGLGSGIAGGTSCSSLWRMIGCNGVGLRLNIDTLLSVDPRVKPEDDGVR